MSKILIVEDDQNVVKLLTAVLESNGLSVVAAFDGMQGTTMAHDEKPDLILLDMIMEPGIDGLETYRRIKEINPNQKVILVSGYSDPNRRTGQGTVLCTGSRACGFRPPMLNGQAKHAMGIPVINEMNDSRLSPSRGRPRNRYRNGGPVVS